MKLSFLPGRGGSPKDGSRPLLFFVLIFFLLAGGIVTVGYFSFKSYERQYFIAAEEQLVAITELKVSELTRWREERMADGAIFFKNPSFSALVRRFFEQPADAGVQRQLQDWLGKFPAYHDYDRVRLVDTQGVTRLSLPELPPIPVRDKLLRKTMEVMMSGQMCLYDFDRGPRSPRIFLQLIVPVLDELDTNRPLGALILRMDPSTYLYPFISRWPVPSKTAETLLVRREGNEAVFLNQLRFQTNTALNLRIPLDRLEVPAVQAALGKKGIARGIDYRGVPVIADIRSVPDSPWVMVARRDVKEVVAEMRGRLWQTLIMIGALLFGAATGVGLVWRQQRVGFYQEKVSATETLRTSELRLKQAQRVARLGHYELDVRAGNWTSSEMLDSLFGMDDAYPRTIASWAQLLHPDDRKATLAYFLNHVVMGKQPFDREYRIVRQNDKAVRWMHGLGQLRCNAEGDVIEMFGAIQDITERKQADEIILRERDFSQAVLNSLPGLFYLFDEQGRFLRWNKHFEEVSGYSADEISRMTPLDFFDETDGQNVTEAIQWAFQRGEAAVEADFLSKNKTRTPYFFTGKLFQFDQKPCVVGMGINITQRKLAEDRSLVIMKDLRASNQDLEQFAYVASHDLQEPLRMVSGYLQLLERRYKNKLDQDANDFIGFAVDGAVRMQQLIDALLEYSRLQVRKNSFEDVDLEPVLQQVLRDLEGRVVETGARITADPLPHVFGDALLLGLVFQNLIGNALKFRGENSPEVHVAAEESSRHWKITVRDNGIGIAPEYQDRIFKIFQRLHSRAEYPGAGIGLAVFRRIIERHGGEAGVRSECGKGSSFWFTLPKEGGK